MIHSLGKHTMHKFCPNCGNNLFDMYNDGEKFLFVCCCGIKGEYSLDKSEIGFLLNSYEEYKNYNRTKLIDKMTNEKIVM